MMIRLGKSKRGSDWAYVLAAVLVVIRDDRAVLSLREVTMQI